LEVQILSDEIHFSHSIECEILEQLKIYSSLNRRLQIPNVSTRLSGPHIEGVAETILDALEYSAIPLTQGRIFIWYGKLFPQNRSGLFILQVGFAKILNICIDRIQISFTIYVSVYVRRVQQRCPLLFRMWPKDQESLSLQFPEF